MSITWSDSKVGYDPGQSQEITVTFKSRTKDVVNVSYKFYARSLGRDDYTYSQRRNVATIWVGDKSVTFKYQLHGIGTSTIKSGTLKISGVKNGVTSLDVKYENDRVGTNSPYYGPKSTGAISKKKIGTLKISDNTKCNIYYKPGYSNGSVVNLPASVSGIYKGSSYTVSSNILGDQLDHYKFTNGYTETTSEPVNLAKPSISKGSSITVNKDNIYLYGCWAPQTYNYTFYKTNDFKIEYSDLKRNYIYASTPVSMPNLNILSGDGGLEYTNPNSPYYKKGYKFKEWCFYYRNNDKVSGILTKVKDTCSTDFSAMFFPEWEALKGNITFNYGFNEYTRVIENYQYDSSFDFASVLRTKEGNIISSTLLRPGCRLVGWTFNEELSKTIYNYSQAPKCRYYVNDKSIIDYPDNSFSNYRFENEGLTLYAVWEYYTTVYIYSKNDNRWHLALPFIYDGSSKKWRTTLAYSYSISQGSLNPSWKL